MLLVLVALALSAPAFWPFTSTAMELKDVSCVAGPDCVANSTKTNGVYVDRMVMRRTPKEQKR